MNRIFPRIGNVAARFFQGLEEPGAIISKSWKKWRKIFQALELGPIA
jgi:hypothetical protein